MCLWLVLEMFGCVLVWFVLVVLWLFECVCVVCGFVCGVVLIV